MARRIDRSERVPRAIEETNEFSARDQRFALLASWDAKEKFKGVATIRPYHLDNRRLMESKPSKLTLKPGGSIVYSSWELSAVTLKPGIYRIDLALNNDPVWRTFFKIQ